MASIKRYRGTRKVRYNGKNYNTGTPLYENMLRLGLPVSEIAKRLKVTYPAVLIYKKDQEKKGRVYNKVPNARNLSLCRAAVASYLAVYKKLNTTQLAEGFGMTYPGVAYILKNAGVTVPDLRRVENKKLRVVHA